SRGGRRPALPVRRAALGAGEVSERLSQAHPPADRAVGEGPIDAGAVPRQGHQGVWRAAHHVGLELPGRQAAAARADRDGPQGAFLRAAAGSRLDFRQDRAVALPGAGQELRSDAVLTRPDKVKLHTLLGNYSNVMAMKDGRVKSDL